MMVYIYDDIHRYTYIYTYICMYIHMHIYIYIYISATALCAFGVTGLVNFAFRLLLFGFSSKLILGPPLIRTGASRIPPA